MFRITNDCIGCKLCEPVCPLTAIAESDSIPYAIADSCDECKGMAVPQCINVCPVECIVKAYSDPEILVGLASKIADVRLLFAGEICRSTLPDHIVERGLTDPVENVRAAFSIRTDFTPTRLQVERGLADPDPSIRSAFAGRSDISLSHAQIERGLIDPSDAVRSLMSARKEFTPTAEQIERGLTDTCNDVRSNFMKRTDCELTEAQLVRARLDSSVGVQIALHHRLGRSRGHAVPQRKVEVEKPKRHDGESTLKKLSPKITEELRAANLRLTQYLPPQAVLFGLKMAAESGSLVLLQPGHSGYAWSDRDIAVVFIAKIGDKIRVRVRRSHSYRNAQVTPAIWDALRGFPGRDIRSKLRKWDRESDGDSLPIESVLALPSGVPACSVSLWSVG